METTTFPLDDFVLNALEHAMEGAYIVDDNDMHQLVGASFSTQQLLDFLGGYHHTDVIRALIAEVRRLRSTYEA